MYSAFQKQRGLTLVELVITIVVLAIALIGVAAIIQGGLSRSADTTLQVRTVALAQTYLDEVQAKNAAALPKIRLGYMALLSLILVGQVPSAYVGVMLMSGEDKALASRRGRLR